MQILNTILDNVGYAGLMLIIISLICVYLSLKLLIYLKIVSYKFKKDFLNKHNDNCSDVMELCKDTTNPLMSIIVDIVTIHAKHSEDIRAEVNYLFYRNFEHVSKSLSWIRLISVISPLLGLMGTVVGMVSVFEALSVGGGSPDPALLAKGISEALLTTIMGIAIAIPSLIVYYYLGMLMKGFQIEVIEHSYRTLDVCKRDMSNANI